jgi:hypothetical protein
MGAGAHTQPAYWGHCTDHSRVELGCVAKMTLASHPPYAGPGEWCADAAVGVATPFTHKRCSLRAICVPSMDRIAHGSILPRCTLPSPKKFAFGAAGTARTSMPPTELLPYSPTPFPHASLSCVETSSSVCHSNLDPKHRHHFLPTDHVVSAAAGAASFRVARLAAFRR